MKGALKPFSGLLASASQSKRSDSNWSLKRPVRWMSLVLLALFVVGCQDPERDMGKQPKARTEDHSEFFADGASARPLPANVINRPAEFVPGAPFELSQKATLPTTRPVITREYLEAGQQQYQIFCVVCHGRLGNGQGMIVTRGLTPPPSFHSERLRNIGDDHFYDVITNGWGAMISYNDRIPPPQRQQIIAYIRALQLAPDIAHADDNTRAELIAKGDHPQFNAGGRQ